MTPIAKTGICPLCPARFEVVGRTYIEIEAKAAEAVAEHLFNAHEEVR